MSKTATLFLLAACLGACGGLAFTSGPEAGDPLDAPTESAPADGPAWGGEAGAGGDELEPTTDVQADHLKPAQDAADCCSDPTQACKGGCSEASADACVPMPPALGQRAYACAASDAGHTSPVPATFAWQTATACGYARTPPECQCMGAYDCACLRAANVCQSVTGSAWVACDDQATNMPIVTCD